MVCNNAFFEVNSPFCYYKKNLQATWSRELFGKLPEKIATFQGRKL
jgi:hypothetical protein